jgi:hypothetical protein
MDNQVNEHRIREELGDDGLPPESPLTAMSKKAVAAAVTFAATGVVAVAVRRVRRRRRSA